MTDTTVNTMRITSITEQAAALGLRRVNRLPFELVYQAYDLATAAAAYRRRLGKEPNVYFELGGYVYVWREEGEGTC